MPHDNRSKTMAEAIDCAYSVEGHGEPLVLIHGIGAARDAWRFMLPHLRDKFTVVTYDLRGHGELGAAAATAMPSPRERQIWFWRFC